MIVPSGTIFIAVLTASRIAVATPTIRKLALTATLKTVLPVSVVFAFVKMLERTTVGTLACVFVVHMGARALALLSLAPA